MASLFLLPPPACFSYGSLPSRYRRVGLPTFFRCHCTRMHGCLRFAPAVPATTVWFTVLRWLPRVAHLPLPLRTLPHTAPLPDVAACLQHCCLASGWFALPGFSLPHAVTGSTVCLPYWLRLPFTHAPPPHLHLVWLRLFTHTVYYTALPHCSRGLRFAAVLRLPSGSHRSSARAAPAAVAAFAGLPLRFYAHSFAVTATTALHTCGLLPRFTRCAHRTPGSLRFYHFYYLPAVHRIHCVLHAVPFILRLRFLVLVLAPVILHHVGLYHTVIRSGLTRIFALVTAVCTAGYCGCVLPRSTGCSSPRAYGWIPTTHTFPHRLRFPCHTHRTTFTRAHTPHLRDFATLGCTTHAHYCYAPPLTFAVTHAAAHWLRAVLTRYHAHRTVHRTFATTPCPLRIFTAARLRSDFTRLYRFARVCVYAPAPACRVWFTAIHAVTPWVRYRHYTHNTTRIAAPRVRIAGLLLSFCALPRLRGLPLLPHLPYTRLLRILRYPRHYSLPTTRSRFSSGLRGYRCLPSAGYYAACRTVLTWFTVYRCTHARGTTAFTVHLPHARLYYGSHTLPTYIAVLPFGFTPDAHTATWFTPTTFTLRGSHYTLHFFHTRLVPRTLRSTRSSVLPCGFGSWFWFCLTHRSHCHTALVAVALRAGLPAFAAAVLWFALRFCLRTTGSRLGCFALAGPCLPLPLRGCRLLRLVRLRTPHWVTLPTLLYLFARLPFTFSPALPSALYRTTRGSRHTCVLDAALRFILPACLTLPIPLVPPYRSHTAAAAHARALCLPAHAVLPPCRLLVCDALPSLLPACGCHTRIAGSYPTYTCSIRITRSGPHARAVRARTPFRHHTVLVRARARTPAHATTHLPVGCGYAVPYVLRAHAATHRFWVCRAPLLVAPHARFHFSGFAHFTVLPRLPAGSAVRRTRTHLFCARWLYARFTCGLPLRLRFIRTCAVRLRSRSGYYVPACVHYTLRSIPFVKFCLPASTYLLPRNLQFTCLHHSVPTGLRCGCTFTAFVYFSPGSLRVPLYMHAATVTCYTHVHRIRARTAPLTAGSRGWIFVCTTPAYCISHHGYL